MYWKILFMSLCLAAAVASADSNVTCPPPANPIVNNMINPGYLTCLASEQPNSATRQAFAAHQTLPKVELSMDDNQLWVTFGLDSPMTDAEGEAIADYTQASGSSDLVNEFFATEVRLQKIIPAAAKNRKFTPIVAESRAMDSALSKSQLILPEGLLVYRGVGAPQELPLPDALSGIVQMKFLSTSLNPAMAYNFSFSKAHRYEFIIEIGPGGIPALMGNATEMELILPRNTVLKLKEPPYTAGGIVHVHVVTDGQRFNP